MMRSGRLAGNTVRFEGYLFFPGAPSAGSGTSSPSLPVSASAASSSKPSRMSCNWSGEIFFHVFEVDAAEEKTEIFMRHHGGGVLCGPVPTEAAPLQALCANPES